MTIPQWALNCIRCPITLESLHLADQELVSALREKLRRQELLNHLGVAVEEDFDAGLVNDSGTFIHAVRDDVPTLLPAEAIPIGEG